MIDMGAEIRALLHCHPLVHGIAVAYAAVCCLLEIKGSAGFLHM